MSRAAETLTPEQAGVLAKSIEHEVAQIEASKQNPTPAECATCEALPVLRRIAERDQGEGASSFATCALAEFHGHPNALEENTNTQALRRTLQREEHAELQHELTEAAAGRADLAQIARECADVLYVTYGTAWAFGIDLDAAFAEVHRAAMDKMRAGLRRADGKIMKPPGFVPPDITDAIRDAHAEPAERGQEGAGSDA